MELTREDLLDLLYGQGEVRRYTQDSPVMPDVWLAFVGEPDREVDLLLTPFQPPKGDAATPGEVAAALRSRMAADAAADAEDPPGGGAAAIAFHQASVAVRLSFEDLVRLVLPMSSWWQLQVRRDPRFIAELMADPATREDLAARLEESGRDRRSTERKDRSSATVPADVLWTLQVVGTLARWRRVRPELRRARRKPEREALMQTVWPPRKAGKGRRAYFRGLVAAAAELLADLPAHPEKATVYSVNLNRPAGPTLWLSRGTIKADATARVFEMDTGRITWAILDSGIEARLPAFRVRDEDPAAGDVLLRSLEKDGDWSAASRVFASYDFTVFRQALAGDFSALPAAIRELLDEDRGAKRKELQESLRRGRALDWDAWEPLLRIPHDGGYRPPRHPHGTHVAGILAADWRPGEEDDGPFGPAPEWPLLGICPEIRLYDLRVLDDQGHGDEFNVMAAIQFLQHLNRHKAVMVVQGANLSLGIRHDPSNYACGATPVCEECDRATGSGLLMVAAAGNEGYEQATPASARQGFRSINITDPGNAESVITVGSTHREMPHLYGVSYFSSRGPTGDGRMKPDLLAPGEKIESCVPDGEVQRMDGTSMAAPHVSGAAAMLLARHRELVGRPARVKRILCDTATTLGRIPEFQGAGLVDCLRALQSV